MPGRWPGRRCSTFQVVCPCRISNTRRFIIPSFLVPYLSPGGKEIWTVDTAHRLFLPRPDAVSRLSHLFRALIGNVQDAVDIPVQQVAGPHAHTRNGDFLANADADGVAMRDDQPGAKILEATQRAHLPRVTQPTIGENADRSQPLQDRK